MSNALAENQDHIEELDAVTLNIFPEKDEFFVRINTLDMTAVAESGCHEKDRKRVHYKLTVNPEDLSNEEQRKILDSTLGAGNYDPKEEFVTPVDIFIQGEYLKVTKIESLGDCDGECC